MAVKVSAVVAAACQVVPLQATALQVASVAASQVAPMPAAASADPRQAVVPR